MAIVRQIDDSGDWTFGKGKNNYVSNQNTVMQNIQTRLFSFLGDCFFDLGAGIDWFNQLGAKDQLALNLSVSAVILNTANVTGIQQLSVNVDDKRKITISYAVNTTYTVISGQFQFDLNGISG